MSDALATLPPKSTPLQRAVALACASLGDIPTPIRTVWNAAACPEPFLPHLAWALSVDRWDDNWHLAVKRAAIDAAYYVHRHKGTVAAVRRVVDSVGYVISITEWWQTKPQGRRGTFSLDVGVRDSGMTDDLFNEMERLIADAKPESRHLTHLAIHIENPGLLYTGAQSYDGDITTIYP